MAPCVANVHAHVSMINRRLLQALFTGAGLPVLQSRLPPGPHHNTPADPQHARVASEQIDMNGLVQMGLSRMA